MTGLTPAATPALAVMLLLLTTACASPSPRESAPTAAVESAECTASISDEDALKRFYEIYMDLQRNTGWSNAWSGIHTIQNPMDVWITQEILFEVKPDYIIEAGTYAGGSAAMWATILQEINPDGRVITIDIENKSDQARKLPIVQRKVDFYVGSSTDPELVADIAQKVKGKTVLVILDSLHTRDHVLDELNAYADIVSVGSYMIVQDGFLNGHPVDTFDYGPGPWEAVEDFMPTTDKYEIDKSRERLLFTFNPNGYLRRVR